MVAKTGSPRPRLVPRTGLLGFSDWARDPRIRDPRAHQTCCGDEREGGLAFRMAGAKKTILAEMTPVVFNKLQARTHFR